MDRPNEDDGTAIDELAPAVVWPAAEHPTGKGNGGPEMSTIAKKENPNEQKVIDALGAALGKVTIDEVAAAAGIGRTSARKYLDVLDKNGAVKRAAGGREGKRKLPDRFSLVPAGEKKRPSEDSDAVEASGSRAAGRLRPGGLDRLVLVYMREHGNEGPFGPGVVAKGLGRSSGAVANSLARMADANDEKVKLVATKPRRYALDG